MFEHPAPDPYRLLGMDISNWTNRVVDFSKAKEAGLDFVVIKAKDGASDVYLFRENWQAAWEADLPRAPLVWLYPSWLRQASAQARALFQLLEEFGHGEIPPVIRFQRPPWFYSPANPKHTDLEEYLQTFEELAGIKPIIRTTASYWESYGNQDKFWTGYHLWLTDFNSQNPLPVPPWGDCSFVQWTANANSQDYGIDPKNKKLVNLSYFNGDLDRFYKTFRGAANPYYRVRDDLQLYGMSRTARKGWDDQRPGNTHGTTMTQVCFSEANVSSGRVQTILSRRPEWVEYIRYMLPGKKFGMFTQDNTGMFNSTDMEKKDYKMDSLTCGCNVLKVRNVLIGADGKPWAEIDYLDYYSQPDYSMTYETHPWLIHVYLIVGDAVGGYLIKAPRLGDIPYPLVSKQSLYIPMQELEPFPGLPCRAVVAADTLNEYQLPGAQGEITGSLAKDEELTIYKYSPRGSSVWGQVGVRRWICLVSMKPINSIHGVEYFTTWRMDTIPPPVSGV
ncbi:MAG: hypothetical protein JXA13_07865 [Anaerolineales bacterium]|nr:hypothetical protein [Anaerolineales bacterium]